MMSKQVTKTDVGAVLRYSKKSSVFSADASSAYECVVTGPRQGGGAYIQITKVYGVDVNYTWNTFLTKEELDKAMLVL